MRNVRAKAAVDQLVLRAPRHQTMARINCTRRRAFLQRVLAQDSSNEGVLTTLCVTRSRSLSPGRGGIQLRRPSHPTWLRALAMLLGHRRPRQKLPWLLEPILQAQTPLHSLHRNRPDAHRLRYAPGVIRRLILSQAMRNSGSAAMAARLGSTSRAPGSQPSVKSGALPNSSVKTASHNTAPRLVSLHLPYNLQHH